MFAVEKNSIENKLFLNLDKFWFNSKMDKT